MVCLPERLLQLVSSDNRNAFITDPNLETVFLNMQSTGLSLSLKKR